MNEERLRSALKACLSNASFPDERQREVLSQMGGERVLKRKVSLALVCAVILSLALAGVAIAAALGVFGQFGTTDEQRSERLQRLDTAAETIGAAVSVSAPEAREQPAEAQTDYDRLLARQYGRSFELTLEQAYCDGSKLYFSYTLQYSAPEMETGEGKPSGFEQWDIENPGQRYEEVWSHDDPTLDESIISWLDGHESGWYAYDSVGLGDGARLSDGTPLNIQDREDQQVDETTIRGYQEVELPEGFEGDTLEIELSVLYGTSVFYQDGTGVYWAHVAQPENRGILRIPFTVSPSGTATGLSGEGAFEEYSARASLLVSDVDISGDVVIDCPEAWKEHITDWVEGVSGTEYVISYSLYTSDGQRMPNRDGSFWINEEGKLVINVRYDRTESTEGLRLRPEYSESGERESEDIALK